MIEFLDKLSDNLAKPTVIVIDRASIDLLQK